MREQVKVFRKMRDFPEHCVFCGFSSDPTKTITKIARERISADAEMCLPEKTPVLDDLTTRTEEKMCGAIVDSEKQNVGRYEIG